MSNIRYMPLVKSHYEDEPFLYDEWVGKEIACEEHGELAFPPINLFTVVAKDVDLEPEEEVIGAAQLIIMYDMVWKRRWGLVENVFVKKSYRGKGIAKGLMAELELLARTWCCEFIKLTSGKDKLAGHALYKSLNYEEGSSFKKWLEPLC